MAFFCGSSILKRMELYLTNFEKLKKDEEPIDRIVLDLCAMEEKCSYEQLLDLYAYCLVHEISLHIESLPGCFEKDKKVWNIPEEKRKEQAGLDLVFPFRRRFASLSGLEKSAFRSSFHLNKLLLAYAREKGIEVLIRQSMELLEQRLFVPDPKKDGKQTPMKGHPVFIAQHATATCCRGCLNKWHHVPKGRKLLGHEKQEVMLLHKEWLEREMARK